MGLESSMSRCHWAVRIATSREIMNDKGSILTMTYFGGERAVPGYNVMGVCKAALDSIVKYLAFDLGPRKIRVNAVSAGPLRTLAGRGAGRHAQRSQQGAFGAPLPDPGRDRDAETGDGQHRGGDRDSEQCLLRHGR